MALWENGTAVTMQHVYYTADLRTKKPDVWPWNSDKANDERHLKKIEMSCMSIVLLGNGWLSAEVISTNDHYGRRAHTRIQHSTHTICQ